MALWYSLAEEEDILDVAAQTDRIVVDTLGDSAGDRPVRRVRIGDPPPGTDQRCVFVTGAVHGNEPAGREAMLEFIRDMANAGPFLQLTGNGDDVAAIPDHSDLDAEGFVSLRIDLALDDYTPGSNSYIFSKYDFANDQRSYALRIGSSDEVQLLASSTGTEFTQISSGEPVPAADGERIALRVDLRVDTDNGDWTATFYTAPTINGTWTQLGTQQTGTFANPTIFNGTADLVIGAASQRASAIGSGRVYAAQVLTDQVLGFAAANPDFQQEGIGTTSFSDSTGKTWTVENGASIESDLTQDQLDYLAERGFIFIPTVNPDGVNNDTRENGNGVDINRDFMALTQPETRLVARAIGTSRPVVMWDMHEYLPSSDDGLVVQVNRAWAAQSDPLPKGNATDLRDQMLDRATSEGWANDIWGATFRGDIRLLDISSDLRHCSSGIVETNRFFDTTSDRQLRADVHYAMLEEIFDFVIGAGTSGTDFDTLLADVETAEENKIQEGAEGTEPFDLRAGGILDPPPLAYDLTTSQLAVLSFHLQVYNIIEAERITMAQQGQPVIPYLMDSDSPYRIVEAERVFDLGVSANVASVREMAEVVHGSTRYLFEARVLTTFQDGPTPTGTMIPVVGGDVLFDATAEVLATLEMETEGVDERFRSLFPRNAGALFSPYGHEVFVRIGADVGSGVLWSPMGYFRINTVSQSESSDSPIMISGSDRMAGIIDARLPRPIQFISGRTYQAVAESLVHEVYPRAKVLFDDDSGNLPIGRSMIVEESRYEGLLDLAESLGKVVYWDGEGVLRIEDAPDPDLPLWDIRAGFFGVLVTAAREVTRDGMRNAFVARGEGASEEPAFALVVDDGANSPTRWFPPEDETQLWFGQVPGFYSSPLLTTGAQAASAAESQLRRHIGMPYNVNFGSVSNPALRPRDAIRITHKDGTREKHIVQTLTVPMRADANMQGTTREQTRVQVTQLL